MVLVDIISHNVYNLLNCVNLKVSWFLQISIVEIMNPFFTIGL